MLFSPDEHVLCALKECRKNNILYEHISDWDLIRLCRFENWSRGLSRKRCYKSAKMAQTDELWNCPTGDVRITAMRDPTVLGLIYWNPLEETGSITFCDVVVLAVWRSLIRISWGSLVKQDTSIKPPELSECIKNTLFFFLHHSYSSAEAHSFPSDIATLQGLYMSIFFGPSSFLFFFVAVLLLFLHALFRKSSATSSYRRPP